jgi:hypothetical protein
MPKLFSSNEKKFLSQIDKPEKELNRFICEHWKDLFPQYTFVASEFSLKGNVRGSGSGGRIDLLAYNPETKKFVIFELKKDHDKNITDQAGDYRDYIQENFSEVYLHTIQKHNVSLPNFTEVNQNAVEIILLAKKFNLTQIERAKKIKDGHITLIKYYWFENDLIFIDYVNNDPDDIKIESAKTKKIREIKDIIAQDPELVEINQYFGLSIQGRDAFLTFHNFLKNKGKVSVEVQQSKIRVICNGKTFSVVKMGGQGIRKAILQINTNINIETLNNNVQRDDRFRGLGKKMKGSLGTERYELFFRDMSEVQIFCAFIEDKVSENHNETGLLT